MKHLWLILDKWYTFNLKKKQNKTIKSGACDFTLFKNFFKPEQTSFQQNKLTGEFSILYILEVLILYHAKGNVCTLYLSRFVFFKIEHHQFLTSCK